MFRCPCVCVCARRSIARRVAPYFDAGAVTCEVYEVEEGGEAAAAGPLAVVALPEPDPTDHPGCLTVPATAVELTGLTPGTHLRVRSRCVAGGGAWRWELPWSEATVVATLQPQQEDPPEVVQVASTHVAAQMRRLGELPFLCVRAGLCCSARMMMCGLEHDRFVLKSGCSPSSFVPSPDDGCAVLQAPRWRPW